MKTYLYQTTNNVGINWVYRKQDIKVLVNYVLLGVKSLLKGSNSFMIIASKPSFAVCSNSELNN